MIALRDVVHRYEDGFELRIDALDVADGERVAIVGPSGAGKTTLVHLMSGILAARSGRIEVAGTTLSDLGDAARRAFRLRHARRRSTPSTPTAIAASSRSPPCSHGRPTRSRAPG